MKRLQLKGKTGKSSQVYFQKLGSHLWMHWQGQTHSILVETKRRSTSQQSAANADSVLAPMPGKILKLAVELNQAVKKGQTLIVMEAMKMEYSFKAERDGVVAKLPFKEGEQVNAGAVLVALEEDRESKTNP